MKIARQKQPGSSQGAKLITAKVNKTIFPQGGNVAQEIGKYLTFFLVTPCPKRNEFLLPMIDSQCAN